MTALRNPPPGGAGGKRPRVGFRLGVAVRRAYDDDRPIAEQKARKAAEAGRVEGMTVYGLGLAGCGRYDEAALWLQAAAAAGDPLAAAALGSLWCEQGREEEGMRCLNDLEERHGALSARLALLQIWARRTLPFREQVRRPGVPDPALPPSPSAAGRQAARCESPTRWAQLRRDLAPDRATDHPSTVPGLLVMRVAEGDFAEAHSWFLAASAFCAAASGGQPPSAGQGSPAEQALREVIARGPRPGTDPEVAKAVGAHMARGGDLAAAEEWFAAAGSADAEAMLFRAQVHGDRFGPEAAEPYYELAADAGDPTAGHTLGVRLAARGENAAAERRFRAAIAAGGTESHLNLGVLLRRRGALEEAERCYRAAVDAGDIADGHNNLGNLLAEERDDLRGAEQHWRVAARHGSAAALTSLGVLSLRGGDLAEAERLFRTSAQAGDPTGALDLAVVLEGTGRIREAEEWRRRVASPAGSGGPADARNGRGGTDAEPAVDEQAMAWIERLSDPDGHGPER